MGAYLAPLVAQEAPDRVRKLVLLDGGIRPALPFFMTAGLTRLVFRRELRSMDRDWPSIEAMAAKAKVGRMVAGRPELHPVVLQMLAEQCALTSAGLRPRVDVDRAVADAVDTFWGDDVMGAFASAQVPVEVLLAENAKAEGQKPFISDKAVAPWRDRRPDLTVRRLKGNHLTVLFDPAVAEAVRA
jgi:pimeloyl-ACP methyl ester carboxylesterase